MLRDICVPVRTCLRPVRPRPTGAVSRTIDHWRVASNARSSHSRSTETVPFTQLVSYSCALPAMRDCGSGSGRPSPPPGQALADWRRRERRRPRRWGASAVALKRISTDRKLLSHDTVGCGWSRDNGNLSANAGRWVRLTDQPGKSRSAATRGAELGHELLACGNARRGAGS